MTNNKESPKAVCFKTHPFGFFVSNFDLSVGRRGCVPSASRFLERKLRKELHIG